MKRLCLEAVSRGFVGRRSRKSLFGGLMERLGNLCLEAEWRGLFERLI